MKWKSWKFGPNARRLPVIRDLKSWADSQGIEVREIYPSVLARRYPSRSIPETLRSIFDRPSKFLMKQRREWDLTKYSRLYSGESYEVPATYELDLADCWLHVPSGTVITPNREVLARSTIALSCFYQGHSEVTWEEAPLIDEDVFLLATAWGRNYAHWLFDILPRAAAVDRCLDRTLLLDRNAPSFEEESMRLIWNNVKTLSPAASLVRCRNIRVHVASAASGVPNPAPLQVMRDRLIEAAGGQNTAGPKRIYISRQKSKRTIVNPEQVEPILQNYGFEEVFCEDLSITEQIRLFSRCEVILGAHGAGTMNTIFASKGTRLIELYNPGWWDHAAHRVASLVGVSHWHLFTENASKAFDSKVDPVLLEKLLDFAISDGNPSKGEEIF
jgi:capsular polysaccharide biosynthesis protein